jgi:hypothetical protein
MRIRLFFFFWLCHQQGIECVATAIGHVIGPFTTMSAKLSLICIKRRLNSSPQPFDRRKSSKIFPSISITLALKISCNFRRSIVKIVTTASSLVFHVKPNLSNAAVNRFNVSSHFVETKNRVIRRTSRWNGF